MCFILITHTNSIHSPFPYFHNIFFNVFCGFAKFVFYRFVVYGLIVLNNLLMIMFECTLCGICCIAYVWLMLLINHEFICLLFLLFFFSFVLFYILCKCNLLNVQKLMEMIMLLQNSILFRLVHHYKSILIIYIFLEFF